MADKCRDCDKYVSGRCREDGTYLDEDNRACNNFERRR